MPSLLNERHPPRRGQVGGQTLARGDPIDQCAQARHGIAACLHGVGKGVVEPADDLEQAQVCRGAAGAHQPAVAVAIVAQHRLEIVQELR